MTQSFRCAVAGVVAISSTALSAAALAGIEKPVKDVAMPENRAPAMVEVLSIGALPIPSVDREHLEAQLREQTRKMAERLHAAIEKELKELIAPKLDIDVADAGQSVALVRHSAAD